MFLSSRALLRVKAWAYWKRGGKNPLNLKRRGKRAFGRRALTGDSPARWRGARRSPTTSRTSTARPRATASTRHLARLADDAAAQKELAAGFVHLPDRPCGEHASAQGTLCDLAGIIPDADSMPFLVSKRLSGRGFDVLAEKGVDASLGARLQDGAMHHRSRRQSGHEKS